MSRVASLNRFINEWFDIYPLLEYKKGQIIIHEEEDPEYLYCMVSGIVKAYTITKYGERNVLEMHKKGEIFSLPALLGNRLAGVYYEASTDVKLRKMPKAVFFESMERSHMVAQAVIWQVLALLNIYGNRIQNLAYRTARERIAARLLFMAARFGREHKDGIIIEIPITHQELADALSITRETASRILEEFKRHDIIDQQSRHFIVKNRAKLHEILE
jgi:CRP/FNR family transcriptional regulator